MTDKRAPFAASGRRASGNARTVRELVDEIATVTRVSVDYPAPLAEVPSAPETLFVRGHVIADDALAVAIVGSRRATPYGLAVAEELGGALAARGVTVVSGLARGIDSAAHQGALDAGGRTIAVLGSGVDVIYPPENRHLARRIAAAGALISQFAPGTRPLPYHFPERNRVIAGLVLAVVVVEAAEKSGALITASFAAELGREVLAVPGRVSSPESRGAHRLIQDGAALVQDADDVIAALPAQWRACVKPSAGAREGNGAPAAVAGDSGRVLAALGEDPVGIDDVIEQSGMGSARATALLLELELSGRVRQLDGKRFVLAQAG
jgi:DNA processing protein